MIGAMHGSRWIGFFVFASVAIVAAQVPVSKEPRHHVTFENQQLRILDVNIPPETSRSSTVTSSTLRRSP
jgi:hypothetical protein